MLDQRELQCELVFYYLDRLRLATGQEVETIIQEAIADKQLLMYGDLYREGMHAGIGQIVLSQLHALSYGNFKTWKWDIEILKIRKLTFLELVAVDGPILQIEDVKIALGFESTIDLFKLILEMNKDGIADVEIDERRGFLTVIQISVVRETQASQVELADQLQVILEDIKSAHIGARELIKADLEIANSLLNACTGEKFEKSLKFQTGEFIGSKRGRLSSPEMISSSSRSAPRR